MIRNFCSPDLAALSDPAFTMRHFRTSILSVCRASRDTRPWPPQYDHRRVALLHLALLDTTPRCIPSVPSSVLTGPHNPIIFSLPLRLRLRFKNTALGSKVDRACETLGIIPKTLKERRSLHPRRHLGYRWPWYCRVLSSASCIWSLRGCQEGQ